ncbi:MAG: LUD domain-containing protein [Archaeoglobus sp.]|nr:LUD domain-containing protein [Archaeoglobus sp.]
MSENYFKMLIEALERNSVEVILSPNPKEEAKKYAGAVVGFAASAAADVGVIFFTGSELKRSALADHHVAVVERGAIMPDIIAAYRLALSKSGKILASSSASKTADIEGKLVWGMHGPRKFTVILEAEKNEDSASVKE